MTIFELHEKIIDIQTALKDLVLELDDVRNELSKRVIEERMKEGTSHE